jgi:ABC-type Fe3+/spermidine/putrescine transport system ATPase subunit
MQVELKTIQREMGITFVFVTHDQEEALTMSDRIAVMNHGRLEQVAPAAEIYERPATAFAAGFIGASNMLACRAAGGRAEIDGIVSVPLPQGPQAWREGDRLMMAIRPEKLFVAPPAAHNGPVIDAVVVDAVFLGATTHLELRAGADIALRALEFHPPGVAAGRYAPGDHLKVAWNMEDAQFFGDGPGDERAKGPDVNLELRGAT